MVTCRTCGAVGKHFTHKCPQNFDNAAAANVDRAGREVELKFGRAEQRFVGVELKQNVVCGPSSSGSGPGQDVFSVATEGEKENTCVLAAPLPEHKTEFDMVSVESDSDVICLFTGEIKYFLKDMKHDLLWWISASKDYTFVRGNEEVQVNWEARKIWKNSKQCGQFFYVLDVPWESDEESDDGQVLLRLGRCRCHQGQVHAFRFPKDRQPNQKTLWERFSRHLQDTWPNFDVRLCSEVDAVARNVVVVPVHIAAPEIMLFTVFNPENGKQYWEFVGGDVSFGKYETWYAAAQREWLEEAGKLLGFKWSEAFRAELPAGPLRMDKTGDNFFLHVVPTGSESCGANMQCQYPCTTYLFILVTEAFFVKTQTPGRMTMPTDQGYVRWDCEEPENLQKVHTEGFLYVECDEYCWQRLGNFEPKTNPRGEDGRKIRKDNPIFSKSLLSNSTWRKWMKIEKKWMKQHQRLS